MDKSIEDAIVDTWGEDTSDRLEQMEVIAIPLDDVAAIFGEAHNESA